ncbi:restriction endonuclease subunit S [Mammaliicoccus sciuri]|uniref:restriction endonuclease subunit S n=1 Tax=Mammaliicoccus sciuri TaxID=1296 RepID=UPI00080769E3|nr:restriction endonuclease subunit S [Mammaliicoccus sciuri]OCA11487.1 type I restriction endonuclease subunit S [Mammaliicoccus sciuri]
MEFNSIKIKDTNIELIDGDRGKNYPKNHEMMDSGHTLFLNNKNIAKNFLDDSFGNFITEDKSDSLKKGKLCRNDIVLSTRGSVGNVGFYHSKIQMNHIRINSGMIILRNNDKKFLDEYLYIFLRSPYMQNKFKEFISGSVQNHLPIRDLQQIEIMYPPIYYQSYIIKIIMNIEEKIKINNQIIANLEELSQTLFKRWFVDFEFPDENGNPYKSSGGEMLESELGMIPKGWEIITINDFANNNVITGKTPSTKIKENYSETGIPFLTIPDMHNDIFALNTERYISELGIEKLSKKVLPKNSLSISCIATPGLISIIANDTLTNQQINSFTPNENALYYLYFKLKGMKDYIRDLGSGGSATLNLNKTQFSKIKLVKPINEILYKYDKLVSPNFKMILNIQKEIQQLTQLRDTLLPKLMSGEIEIPDDIEVNEDELSI